jgi:C1A family cysteine protease
LLIKNKNYLQSLLLKIINILLLIKYKMYNDIYDDEPDTWTFQPPKTCNLKSPKLFDLRPYYGPRLNRTSLIMDVQPHKKQIKGLSDIQVPLPTEFSWRKKGGEMIEQGGLRDQGKCGGCWAFATVSALGDRYALKYNLLIQVLLG